MDDISDIEDERSKCFVIFSSYIICDNITKYV